MGVSTNRIHSRGPVGVDGLLIYKYQLFGSGQVVSEYSSGAKKFTHAQLPLNPELDRLRLGMRAALLVALGAAAWGVLLAQRLRQ